MGNENAGLMRTFPYLSSRTELQERQRQRRRQRQRQRPPWATRQRQRNKSHAQSARIVNPRCRSFDA